MIDERGAPNARSLSPFLLDAAGCGGYYPAMPDTDQDPDARARVKRMVRRYVERGTYRLNPDAATVEHVLVGLARNLVRHGRAYCPCREVTGDPARDRLNLCPCPQHPRDIARDGVCECGLFVRTDQNETTDEEEE